MTSVPHRRPVSVAVALVTVAASAGLLTGAVSPSHDDATTTMSHRSHTLTGPEVRFHDRMRKLWEDHITWTRLAIVTFADGSAGFDKTAARLLRNQVAIGDAIKPFYGDAAGNRLTALLKEHITIAVELLQAAKAGDGAAFEDAKTRWYRNANDIADFLAGADPRHWPDAVMRRDMKVHLDQTLAEAADELGGHYLASVRDYGPIHRHILKMADMLSEGIMASFPGRFR
jgi:hypothetical protein